MLQSPPRHVAAAVGRLAKIVENVRGNLMMPCTYCADAHRRLRKYLPIDNYFEQNLDKNELFIENIDFLGT